MPPKTYATLEKSFNKRMVWMTILLFVSLAAIIFRLASLQLAQGSDYRVQADGQRTSVRTITAKRGEIKIADRFSGQPETVATSIDKPLVYAIPASMTDREATAKTLAPILGMSEQEILDKTADASKKYVPLKHQITEADKKKIADLKLSGIAFDSEVVRFYPEGSFLSQLLGFVGYKDDTKTGLYGIEQAFNEYLTGTSGSLAQERSASGAWIFGARRDQVEAQDGDTILLTIDKTVQFKAESVIKKAVEDNLADSGSIVIMDPKTGAIVAMATYPTFDPNDYAKVTDPSVYNNQITQGAYEPGSIFKPITLAAAINEGAITAQTTYNDTGAVNVDGYTIENSDHKAHGVQTMTQALEQSLNTGMIYAKGTIGNKKFLEYVERFGLGKKTGIEVAENKGDLENLSGNIDVNYDTASFGQGINITPIQMLQAYGAMANGGRMMKPYVVNARIGGDGKVEETKPEEVGQPITIQTASTISAMLVNVVENGHGKKAAVKGYYVAGKTGTAQVPLKGGKGYDLNNNIGSFAGYAPVDDPRFVMLVRVNHPRTVSFAESTAAPAFGTMAQFLLQYYNVQPTRLDQITKK
ncbi:MAG TPA: penicillin-binding protein 2 [Patescibacteria group bacterium]|jgi:cell division protein FtsI/penicillin-binding protein 2|nr:penicillin-binding protein 2 [Patescibacteria group bacterium]